MKHHLYLGCTLARHEQIGIHAVINARGGQHWRNNPTQEETEQMRDARKIRDWHNSRIRFYQFNSRAFRRRLPQLSHLLSSYAD